MAYSDIVTAALPLAERDRVTDAVAVAAPVAAPPPVAVRQAPQRVTVTLVLDLAPGADASVVRAHVAPAGYAVRIETDFRGDDETLPLHVFVARRP